MPVRRHLRYLAIVVAASAVAAGAERRDFYRSVPPLRHHYVALRHGQSLANVAGVISSDPKVACAEHGLSDKGWEQAPLAARTIAAEARWLGVDGVVVVTSDLRRARQTALAVRSHLIASGVNVLPADGGVIEDKALRERSFGELDGQSDDRYDDVWVEDARSATHEEYGVESVLSVRERARGVVDRMEADERLGVGGGGQWLVVLVAHGDVLQILQTAFARVDPRRHRSLEHLKTATMRRLRLADEDHGAEPDDAGADEPARWRPCDESKIDPRWREAARSWPPTAEELDDA